VNVILDCKEHEDGGFDIFEYFFVAALALVHAGGEEALEVLLQNECSEAVFCTYERYGGFLCEMAQKGDRVYNRL
jgi:hypothetical protein